MRWHGLCSNAQLFSCASLSKKCRHVCMVRLQSCQAMSIPILPLTKYA